MTATSNCHQQRDAGRPRAHSQLCGHLLGRARPCALSLRQGSRPLPVSGGGHRSGPRHKSLEDWHRQVLFDSQPGSASGWHRHPPDRTPATPARASGVYGEAKDSSHQHVAGARGPRTGKVERRQSTRCARRRCPTRSCEIDLSAQVQQPRPHLADCLTPCSGLTQPTTCSASVGSLLGRQALRPMRPVTPGTP